MKIDNALLELHRIPSMEEESSRFLSKADETPRGNTEKMKEADLDYPKKEKGEKKFMGSEKHKSELNLKDRIRENKPEYDIPEDYKDSSREFAPVESMYNT